MLHVASIDVVRSRLIQHHAQCNATLHNSVQHRATLRNTAQHVRNTVQHVCNTGQHCATLHNTAQHCVTLCNTAQHHATLRKTVFNTAQHCATLRNTRQHVRNTCATLCILLNEGYTTFAFTRPEMLEIEPTLKISPTYEIKLQVDADSDNGPR